MLLQSWAAAHRLLMVVELDHCVEANEYEEIVALYQKDRGYRRWLLWCSLDGAVVVQPLLGRARRFASVAEAIEALSPYAT